MPVNTGVENPTGDGLAALAVAATDGEAVVSRSLLLLLLLPMTTREAITSPSVEPIQMPPQEGKQDVEDDVAADTEAETDAAAVDSVSADDAAAVAAVDEDAVIEFWFTAEAG